MGRRRARQVGRVGGDRPGDGPRPGAVARLARAKGIEVHVLSQADEVRTYFAWHRRGRIPREGTQPGLRADHDIRFTNQVLSAPLWT